jgi:hypothetical protein
MEKETAAKQRNESSLLRMSRRRINQQRRAKSPMRRWQVGVLLSASASAILKPSFPFISSTQEYLSDKFGKNDTVKGSVFQGHPFELAITTRKEDKLEGIIEWPTLDNTITKWRGKIEGSSISIEEFETMEGDGVEVPNNYVGKFSSGKIVGMATDPHGETSRFEITLPS